jgi:hypothetical protein
MLDEGKTAMNAQTKLPIIFAPTNELNSWSPRISTETTESVSGARASARFNAVLSSGAENTSTLEYSQRSGVNAALRIAPGRCRTARRRLFAPNHNFEHRLP